MKNCSFAKEPYLKLKEGLACFLLSFIFCYSSAQAVIAADQDKGKVETSSRARKPKLSPADQKLADRYLRQGLKYLDDKKYSAALQQLAHAKKVAPNSGVIYNCIGAVYAESGNMSTALSQFHKAVNVQPNFYKAWVNLGNAYVMTGRYKKAQEVINHGKIRFRNHKDAIRLLGQCQQSCNALVDMKKLGETDKSKPDYRWINHAQKFVVAGDFLGAEKTLQDGLNRFPNSLPIAIELAINFQRLKKYERAADAWKYISYSNPKNPKFALMMMAAQTRAGNLKELQSERKEFAKRFPKHKQAKVMMQMHEYYGRKDKINAYMKKKYGSTDFRAPYVGHYPILVYVHKRFANKTVWNARRHGQTGQSDYIELIDQAFNEWVKASNGRLNFQFVKDRGRANIECAWTNDVRQLHLSFAGGVTKYGYNSYGRPKSTIYLLLQDSTFDRGEFYHTCLHEIGHALGLAHSDNPQDIMYFSTGSRITRKGGLPRLSTNDKARLLKNYRRYWDVNY